MAGSRQDVAKPDPVGELLYRRSLSSGTMTGRPNVGVSVVDYFGDMAGRFGKRLSIIFYGEHQARLHRTRRQSCNDEARMGRIRTENQKER